MMRTLMYNKIKLVLINMLGIASFVLCSNSTAIAKETSSISSTDLGSGRIKAETAKPKKKLPPISSGDLGSGRIKAEKDKTK